MSLMIVARRGGIVGVSTTPESTSIIADNAAVSITTDGTSDITVTLTRNGGYSGTVTLGVTGLPTGVTASYPSGQTYTGSTTSRIVRLTGSSAPNVSADAFTITATGTGGIDATPINGTVTVTSASAFTPNLPSGMTLVADSSFETFNTGDTGADGIEVINWPGNTVEDSSSFGVRSSSNTGGYGTKSIRAWFPGNHAGDGVGPLTLMVSDLNSREHYMACYMRYSSNYVFHTNGEKFFYPVENVPAEGNWGASLLNVGANRELGGASSAIQGAGPGEPKTASNVIPGDGSWFLAEFYGKMNTPGNFDGEWKAWINGTNVFSTTSWQFSNHPSSQMSYSLGRRDLTRGGGVSSILTPAEGQWVEIDRLAFYKR
jgi:hypothetical protein